MTIRQLALRRRRTRSSEPRGVAVVELAICLPLLFLLGCILLDVGTALDQYFRVVEIAREAAKIGAKVDTLSGARSCFSQVRSDKGALITSPPGLACSDSRQLLMHDRALMLLSILPQRWSNAFFTSYIAPLPGFAATDMVTFSVAVELRPYFWRPIGGITLRTQVTATRSVHAAKLSISTADESLLKSLFGYGACSAPTAGTVMSQGLLVNLAGASCST